MTPLELDQENLSEDVQALDEDTRARKLALDSRLSIALQAPAGSGKTTVLTQRVLALLAVVDEPEAILAVTFTRKAAAEMRSRVLTALMLAAQADSPPNTSASRDRPSGEMSEAKAVTLMLARAAWQRAKERGWELLDNPARLRIQTIDGLNHRLAGSMPVSARGVAQLQLADALTPLYREAARRCLLDAEGDQHRAESSRRVFLRVNNDWGRLESLIAAMLARRSSWQRGLLGQGASGLEKKIIATLTAARSEAVAIAQSAIPTDLVNEGLALARHAAEMLQRSYLPTSDASEFLNLKTLAELALVKAKIPALRSKVTKKEGFPSDQKVIKQRMVAWLASLERLESRGDQDLLNVLDELRCLPSDLDIQDDLADFSALGELLHLALAELHVLFAERGLVDHTAVADTALHALESGALEDWAQLNNERLQHILIDEFQDTSADQLRLLRALTKDWQPDEDRSLFVVGDPMQSIYQFRDADVGLFTVTQRLGISAIPLMPLRLTRNFRSRPSVVSFVNSAFAKIFPATDHPMLAAARYVPCIAGQRIVASPDESDGVRWHAVALEADDSTDSEATRVLKIVQETWSLDPRATVAVLVASRRHADSIVLALQASGVAVQGVDLIPLAETPVVLDLMALTRALHDRADRIAWMALLRSPACGLQLAPLTAWLEIFDSVEPNISIVDALRLTFEWRTRGAASVPIAPNALAALQALAIDDIERLLRVWSALAADLRSRDSLAARVERCWLRARGPWCYASKSVAEDARRYLDTLATHELSGRWRGVEDFAWMLEGLYAGPQSGSRRESQTATQRGENQVQVMTIHRAKGLEFDCVILPGLARPTHGDDGDLLNAVRWMNEQGHEAWVMAPIRGADEPKDRALLSWIKKKRGQRTANERTRVWYVAATRAKRWLHWVAQVDDPDTPPRKGTALAALWPALEQGFRDSVMSHRSIPETANVSMTTESASVTSGHEAAQMTTQPEHQLSRLPQVLPSIELPVAVMPSSLTLADRAAIDLSWVWVGGAARRAGTVVHRELERLARHGNIPIDVAAYASAQTARWRAALHREGVAQTELDAMTRRVTEAISRCLNDPKGRWLLGEHARENEVELALSGWVDGELVNGVLDRCFIDQHGVRWVIDYKTTTHEGGDLEFFLSEQVRRYEQQMQRYVSLARGLGPEPVRAGLYFPWLQRFIELPV